METLIVFAIGVAVGHFGVAKLVEWFKSKSKDDPSA